MLNNSAQLLEIVDETRLLGCVITPDLKFHKNTQFMVKRAYARMIILHRLYSFNVATEDLVIIYILYIRSLLEQNVAAWNYAITQEECEDIERVQKVAVKIILKDDYSNYEESLTLVRLEKLQFRKRQLCLKFAKKCLNNEKTAAMFPVNPSYISDLTRYSGKKKVNFAHTDRLMYSAIPALQRLLNEQ